MIGWATADATLPVKPPGDEVAVKLVIGEPPSNTGAVYVTVAFPFPAVAITEVGAPGTVDGVTEAELADVTPVPITFVAVTTNV